MSMRLEPGPSILCPRCYGPWSVPIQRIGCARAPADSSLSVNSLQELSGVLDTWVIARDGDWLLPELKRRSTARCPFFFLFSIGLALRHFDQLDLAVFATMQHIDLALRVAEDEHITIAELALLHRFLHGHRAHGNGIIGAHQVCFGGAGDGGKLVHDHRDSRGGVGADRDLQLALRLDRSLPTLVSRLAMRVAPPAIVAEHLRLDVLQGLVDCDDHVGRFGQSHDMAAAPFHRDFRDAAVLFDRQDDLALDVFTKDLGEFGKTGFHFFTNGGSNFVLPSKILYCHWAPS